jgi:cytochrome P450
VPKRSYSTQTISVINSAILGLLLNPEVQKKAQAEADRVLGSSGLPEFSDLDSLPYIKSVVREALRWRVAAPLAIPHRLMEDDVYNDMFMPAGAVVVGNSWSVIYLFYSSPCSIMGSTGR